MNANNSLVRVLSVALCVLACGTVLAQENAGEVVIEAAVPPAEAEEGIRFNFRDVPLQTILDYLSKSAGFAIVLDAEVSGTVNVISHQLLSDDEAVQLLNSVLYDRGFTAVRNGRVLRIVSSDQAGFEPLPVIRGSDPEGIPKTHQRVTQIMPMRYATASQLIQDLQPLMPAEAIVTANASSNSIVITDTQINIRRIAEIVQALDTATLNVSTVRVFRLERASATETANLINQVFASQGTSGRGTSSRTTGSSDRTADFISRFRSLGFSGRPTGR